jgi:DNA-directed RNA polymerase II subunit RPB1
MTTAPGFAYSEAPLKTVQEIQFGLFSPEETKNMSVCHIEYPETMDEQRMRPRERGLNDPKLGSIDRAYKCATCGENMTECPGHFGHIELAVPVFHPGTLCDSRASCQESSANMCFIQASSQKSRRSSNQCATTAGNSWMTKYVTSAHGSFPSRR